MQILKVSLIRHTISRMVAWPLNPRLAKFRLRLKEHEIPFFVEDTMSIKVFIYLPKLFDFTLYIK